MNTQLASILILTASLVQPSYALVTRRRKGRSVGGIIGGCIVAAVVILLLLCVCFMMARRRRARQSTTAGPGGGGSNQYGSKSMFGGLLGRSNAANNGKNTPMHPNQGVNNMNGAQPQTQAPYNPEYPGSNTPAPPPTYGQDAEYGRQFAAPSGPPPAAHTTGKDNQFVGGFRS